MKTDSLFKRAYNDTLDHVIVPGAGKPLPSEAQLCLRLDVSRTTVRKVIAALAEQGLVEGPPGHRLILRGDGTAERFPEGETVKQSERLEPRFMEWVLRADLQPGTSLNELELARRFRVATTTIREFLHRFSRFGLVERRPNGRWVLLGFTSEFAHELFEIREMFELRSARKFVLSAPEAPVWTELEAIRIAHLEMLAKVDTLYPRFSDLDSAFHQLINSVEPNRFIDGFFDVITMIFHYHYQWDKSDELRRNEVAMVEHLKYIDALKSREADSVENACRAHLASARRTLLATTQRDRKRLLPA